MDISSNNTVINYAYTLVQAMMRSNHGALIISINDLIFNNVVGAKVFNIGAYGASFIVKNLCAYSEAGKLTELFDIEYPSGQPQDIDNLLEVDPLLDGDYEPLEEQVRTGGSPDILGDATAIGAIKTMNTTVINTAVQAALTSGGVKLAADGLDNVVVAEPSGDPSGWSFAQGLKWLIMRFFNKHSSDNFSGIVVHKSDGSTSTSQPVTEVDGVKAVGKAQ